MKNAGEIMVDAIGTEEEKGETTEHLDESRIRRMILQMVEEPLNEDRNTRFNLNGFNILITDDGRGVAKSLSKKFKESNAHVEIMTIPGSESKESLIHEIERIKKSGRFNGIVHLVPLEESGDIDTIGFEEWKANTFRRVKSLFFIVKSLHHDLIENAKKGEAFIVSATPMGGRFGIEDFTAPDPIGGGVTGLMKSLNKELEGVLVKSIDFSRRVKPTTVAKAIVNEIQWGDNRVEVGHAGTKRMIPQVVPDELDRDIEPRLNLEKGSVFVITGGGYGITGEIAKDIAKTFRPQIAIISRHGLPANIEELASLDDGDLKELKDKLIEELKSTHERVTPVMIEKEYEKYTSAIEKYNNIQDMKKLGAEHVEYYSCDVTDHEQMSETIKKIRENYGRIDAIIHGAGIEQSKLLNDKKYEDFSRVFDVKADGCFNLIELTREDDIKLLVAFSSIAGRFGNSGQTDYAAANDLLNKYIQHSIKRFNGRMKGVSINWTGWKEVGMVTRGSLMKIFEEGGVDLITVNEGVQRLRDEILYGDSGEVIIAGNIGTIDSDGIIAATGSKEFLAAMDILKSKKDEYPLIDEILAFEEDRKVSVRKRLDPERDIYLKDHAIENVPYLPAVMGIEAFAEAAKLLLPEMRIKAMRDIQFKLPIKILNEKPVDIIVTIEKTESREDEIRLSARIETEFFNRDGIKLGDNRLHFSAEILLSGDGISLKKSRGNGAWLDMVKQFGESGEIKIDRNEIYQRFFHGPRFQVHGGVIGMDGNTIVGIVAEKNGDIFSFVKRPKMIANPLAIEAVLQNAGIWGMAKSKVVSLPDAIEELTFQAIPDTVDDLFIGSQHTGSENNRNIYEAELFDSNGTVFAALRGYKMITTGKLEECDEFRF
jgi:NAD(P)-dependent dehydrogenase (short-subunit alcohol dehydrogenase family)/3-hydroxymyristoyl/3-hydroxydecanoyl-(acyl carrier protein) dehydratase